MQAFSQKNSSIFGKTISNALQKMFHGLEQTILGTYWEISGLFHSRRRHL